MMHSSIALHIGRTQSQFTLTFIPDTIQNAIDIYGMENVINATNIPEDQRATEGVDHLLNKLLPFAAFTLSL